MKILGIIPARLKSKRFPEKVLANIEGKSVIQRVYEKAVDSNVLEDVVVAADSDKVYDHVKAFGGNVVMTSTEHNSGTERCAEALCKFKGDFDAVINVQGDEPFIHRRQIRMLAELIQDNNIASLAKKIDNYEELNNTNIVKLVVDKDSNAIYFTRTIIPYIRGKKATELLEIRDFFKHIGVYAYKADVLREIVKLPACELERNESLEQLRWVYNSYKIQIGFTELDTLGIDTKEDLELAKKFVK